MINAISKELCTLYSNMGVWVALYIRLRWRLCPFQLIEKQIPLKGTVIDIGCGYGLLSNLLALRSEDRHVIGVDLSPRRIKIAQKTVNGRRNIKFYLSDITKLKVWRGGCNAVVASDFLHHISYESQEELLRSCYQTLPKGGLLIIQDVDTEPCWKYYSASVIDAVLNPGMQICFRSRTEFLKLLRRIGFRVETKSVHKGLPLSDILYICRKD